MSGWGTPEQVALYVGRPARTIRTWAQRGQIPSACDVSSKRLLVHAASARRRAEEAQGLTLVVV